MTEQRILIDRYGHAIPVETVNRALEVFSRFNPEQQNAAIDIALGPPEGRDECYLPVIHGPPGTGKTLVICVASILYLARKAPSRRKVQVVIVTFTNYAADQVVRTFRDRLAVDPHLLKRLAWREFDKGLTDYYETTDPAKLRHKEKQELEGARIFVVTAHSSGRARSLSRRPLIIFDEVSQINTPLFVQGSINFRMTAQNKDIDYVCLVGDPNQLPIVTHEGELRTPIINSLVRPGTDGIVRVRQPHVLRTQYRMHPAICDLVNELGILVDMPPLRSAPDPTHTLHPYGYAPPGEVPEVLNQIMAPENAAVLVDTSELPGSEIIEESKANPFEAELVSSIWKAFNEYYERPPDSGRSPILTPYSLQRAHISSNLTDPGIVRTVDEMQGRESDLVVYSGVRQNPLGYIGFVGDFPRIFVACSRARRKLVLVMAVDTFIGNPAFKAMFDFFSKGQEGTYLTRIDLNQAQTIMSKGSGMGGGVKGADS